MRNLQNYFFMELDYKLFVRLMYKYVRHRLSLQLINIHLTLKLILINIARESVK